MFHSKEARDWRAAYEALERQFGQYRAEAEQQRQAFEAYRAEAEAQRQQFEAYRAEVGERRQRAEAEAAEARKRTAYRRLLAEARVPERFHERILRLTPLEAMTLDGDGFADEAAAREAIRRDWGDYVGVDRLRGLAVDSPPAADRPGRPTAREIMAIEDDDRRQREIARNHELFGF